jgi:hypothetical protein
MTSTASPHVSGPGQVFGYDTGVGESAFTTAAPVALAKGATRRDGHASRLLAPGTTAVAGSTMVAVGPPRGIPSGLHGPRIVDEEIDDNGVVSDNVVQDGE